MDKNVSFPQCANNCEVVKILGVGECENICAHKFYVNGKPKKCVQFHMSCQNDIFIYQRILKLLWHL